MSLFLRTLRGPFTLLLALAVLGLTACTPQSSGPGPETSEPPPPPSSDPPTGAVPFTLALEAFSIDGLPGLHSFAAAGTADQLVLLAGRTNGLHGFAPSRQAAEFPSFPKEYANDTVYVVNLTTGTLLGQAKVTALPQPYVNQLTASNTQYWLEDGFLYIVGGYGPDPATGTLVTLPYVTVIDFAALVSTVTAGGALDATFAAANMTSVQQLAAAITGGDVQVFGGQMLLAYGHRFDGEYTPGGGQALQQYSNSVRVFTFNASRGTDSIEATVEYQGSVPDTTTGLSPDNPYHRRDLTVKPAFNPQGDQRIAVYGGVFKGGRQEGYVHPLYIDPGTSFGIAVSEDTDATQWLSQYDCATIQLYSATAQAQYSTFFGGISFYYWDPACACLKHDPVDIFGKGVDGLPFINSISTFKVTAQGSTQYLHQGATFPPATAQPVCVDATNQSVPAQYLGAETKFFTATGVPLESNGVIPLDQVQAGALGYLVGGIAAHCDPGDVRCYASTQGASCASSLLYRVVINPAAATPTVELVAPVEDS